MFSYQGSCRSFLATALIFYQISFALSRTFLFFCFAHLLSSRSASSDSLYRLSHLQGVVNSFFHLFFQRFRLLFPALLSPAVPPPRLRLTCSSADFQGPVISDRCYLITTEGNCQCFFSFLFISDNSHNSDRIWLKIKTTTIFTCLPFCGPLPSHVTISVPTECLRKTSSSLQDSFPLFPG